MKQNPFLPTKDYLLPPKNWKTLKLLIKRLGEEDNVVGFGTAFFNEDLTSFLRNIKLIDGSYSLTSSGRQIFSAIFIRLNDVEEREILRSALLAHPPALALQQYLWGLKNVGLDQAITVLKATKTWDSSTPEELTHFLDILNFAGIISYDKRGKQFRILVSPDTEKIPTSVFIDPMRPYSNIRWIKTILSELNGYIYWLDKHFQKEALDWLWAIADSEKIKEIKILSLDLGNGNLTDEAKNLYKRLKQELLHKGIRVTWATIDSKEIKDAHDRWIVADESIAWNVPNVNAISSGQRSELNRSENYERILKVFNEYWSKSKEITNS